MSEKLLPGSVIGILGGGQLGRMMACEAARLGFDVHIFSPDAQSPAGRVSAYETVADYSDTAALQAFSKACDVVTYEFENVPVRAVEALRGAGGIVRPGGKALECSQDRLAEKRFLRSLDIPTVDFEPIGSVEDLEIALSRFGRAILKTSRDGYDGKGQVRLVAGDRAEDALAQIHHAPAILEAFSPFEKEISVLAVRGLNGQVVAYDIPENTHEAGILRRSNVPAQISDQTAKQATEAAKRLIEALDYVGVLALEFFVLNDGSVVANEFAPRVHNSGHWTPELCDTGQFEQHIRAVAGLPLGSVTRRFDGVMENLLGEEILAAAGLPGVTLYGKGAPSPGRKMGHAVKRQRPV